MDQRPGMFGKLLAHLRGEIPADTLEAYRRAGGGAYDLLNQAESRRRELKDQGHNPWEADPATQAFLLCAWNAFLLQALGDQFLEADYRQSPATTGFVPPVTAEQVLSFYSQVEGWLSRAHQAQSNAAFRLDVAVPADLPAWSAAEPCPRSHLEGMLAATRLLQPHAESAMQTFEAQSGGPERQAAVQQLRQLLADADSKTQYAEQLWSRDVPRALHEGIENSMKAALAGYYHLGQLLAMPQLVATYRQPGAGQDPAVAHPGRSLPGPGEAGFDPWCLTDPTGRGMWQQDAAARQAIATLWSHDPSPDRTLAIQGAIDAALARGDIAYATDRSGERIGWFYCCPWAPVYVVKRPLTIAGRRLSTLQQFTFDVSAEGVLTGEPFRRDVLVANFGRTAEVDYCNPLEGRSGA